MPCLTPITLVRKTRGSRDNQNSLTDVVPCGKCPECHRRRQSGWAFRLEKEQLHSMTSAFTTLTYEDKYLPFSKHGNMTLRPSDHQKFMKKLRKKIRSDKRLTPNQPSLKYYAVGEYGATYERPHYHQIIFNLPQYYIDRPQIISDIWGMGSIQVAECNIKTINYVTGYIIKQIDNKSRHHLDDRIHEFSHMSKAWAHST